MKAMKVSVAGPNADHEDENEIQDHEVHGALMDMARVEQHKQNPQLMAKVKELAKRAHKQASGKMRSIKDLKDRSNQLAKEPVGASADADLDD